MDSFRRHGLRIVAAGNNAAAASAAAATSPPSAGGAAAASAFEAPFLPGAFARPGLALVCGPFEFNQDVLSMLLRYGFKRGLNNLGGKDVHVF